MPVHYAASSPMIEPGSRRSKPTAVASKAIDRLADLRGTSTCQALLQQAQTLPRIALRCEKTIAAFIGFVHHAFTMIRLR
jgi:hypothetical protein